MNSDAREIVIGMSINPVHCLCTRTYLSCGKFPVAAIFFDDNTYREIKAINRPNVK